MTGNFNHRPRSLVENQDYAIDAATGCWNWLGWTDQHGYGHAQGTEERRAHRESYRQAKGAIPGGWHIHHLCENKSCINPDHLEAKSHSDHLRGHRVDESLLTWDDVRAIRGLHAAGGTSIYEIGERFGIKKSQVWKIVRGLSWPDPDYTPGRLILCAECGEEFAATKHSQRFCCRKHRYTFNNRKNWAQRHAA